ncbi:hypothetical protein [Stenotrophomonas phage RAS14]
MYKDALQIIYYFRGAITLNEIWETTPYERNYMRAFLDERFEHEKDRGKAGHNMVY